MRILPVAATVGIVTACASQASVDLAAEREALGDAARAYHQVVNGGDLDAFSSLYAMGAVMMPPNEPSISGEASIQGYAERFRAIEDFAAEMELGSVEVSPDGQWGYTVARVVVSGMSDGQPIRETLRDVHIWTRDMLGEWKVAIDVWNSLDPVDGMD